MSDDRPSSADINRAEEALLRGRDEPAVDRTAHVEAAANALVVADDLVAGYLPGVNILTGCDLYANRGELVGIIGPNGDGKRTLLKALFGLVNIR